MKKLLQRGFGAVEMLLVVVLLGLVGGVGYYVYNQSKNNDDLAQTSNNVAENNEADKEPEQEDETADWLVYKASDNSYSVKLADGWKMLKTATYTGLLNFDNELELKPGTPATITTLEVGGRGGGRWLSIDYVSRKDKEKYNDYNTHKSGEMVSTSKTDSGLTVEHYHKNLVGSTEAVDYDRSYSYYVSNKNGMLVIYYGVGPGETSHHKVIEKILPSIQLN